MIMPSMKYFDRIFGLIFLSFLVLAGTGLSFHLPPSSSTNFVVTTSRSDQQGSDGQRLDSGGGKPLWFLRFGKPSLASKASASLKSSAAKGQQQEPPAAVENNRDGGGSSTVEDQIHEMSVFLALRLGRSLLRTLQERIKEQRQRGDQVQPGGNAAAWSRSPPALSSEASVALTPNSFKTGDPASLDASSVKTSSMPVGRSNGIDPSPTTATAVAGDKVDRMAEKPKSLHRREGDRVVALGDDFFTEDSSETSKADPDQSPSDGAAEIKAAGSGDLPLPDVAATTLAGDVPEALSTEQAAATPIPSTVSLEFGRPLEVERTTSPPLSPDVALKVEHQQFDVAEAPDAGSAIVELEETSSTELSIEPASEGEPSGSSFMALDSLALDSLLGEIPPENEVASTDAELAQDPSSKDAGGESTDPSLHVKEAISQLPSFSSPMLADYVSLNAAADNLSGSDAPAAAATTPGDATSEPEAKADSSATPAAAGSGFVMLSSPTSVEESTASTVLASKNQNDEFASSLTTTGASDAEEPSDAASTGSGSGFNLRRNSTTMDGSNVSTFSSSSSSTALSGSVLMEAEIDIQEGASLTSDETQDGGSDGDGLFSGLLSSESIGTVDKVVLESLESAFAMSESMPSDGPVGALSAAPELVVSTKMPPNSLDSMIDFLQALGNEDSSASTAEVNQLDSQLTPESAPDDADRSSSRVDRVSASPEDISADDKEPKQSAYFGLRDPEVESPRARESVGASIPIRKNWSPYGTSWKASDKIEASVERAAFNPISSPSAAAASMAKTDRTLPAELDPTDLFVQKRSAQNDGFLGTPEATTRRTSWSPYGKRSTAQSSEEKPLPEKERTTDPAGERPGDALAQKNWSPFGGGWTAPSSVEPSVPERIAGSILFRDESARMSVESNGRWNPFKPKAVSSKETTVGVGDACSELGARETNSNFVLNSIGGRVSTEDEIPTTDCGSATAAKLSSEPDTASSDVKQDDGGELRHEHSVEIQPSFPARHSSFPKGKWNPFQPKPKGVTEIENPLYDYPGDSSSQVLVSNDGEDPRHSEPGLSGLPSESGGPGFGRLATNSPVIESDDFQATRSTSFLKSDMHIGNSVSANSFSLGYRWHGDNWASSTLVPNMAKPPSLSDSTPEECPALHSAESGSYVWYTIPKYPEVPRWQEFAKYSGIHWTRPDYKA